MHDKHIIPSPVLTISSYIKNSEWRLIRRGAPSSIACGKFPLMLMAFKTPDTMGWNNMHSNRTKNNKSFHYVIIIFICRSTSFWFQFSSLICTLTFTAHSWQCQQEEIFQILLFIHDILCNKQKWHVRWERDGGSVNLIRRMKHIAQSTEPANETHCWTTINLQLGHY